MRLECDLGNSFLKWRLLDSEQVSQGGQVPVADASVLAEQVAGHPIDQIWVGSVADEIINQRLSERLEDTFSVQPEFARVAPSRALNLNPSYQQPEKMGVDRWLALLAAAGRYRAAALVVDAGSAVTLDQYCPTRGQLGGFILPGYQMLLRSLRGDTARVRFDAEQESDPEGGFDTASCVHSGVDLVLRGVASEILKLFKESAAMHLVVTGGDAQRLIDAGLYRVECDQVPDLVLDGLSFAERRVL